MANRPDPKPSSFQPPAEPEWHRMIAEAAYHLAETRGFLGEHSLDDWLAAEEQIRHVISRTDSAVPKDGKQSVSRFEKFAATQAAGDGIQGDVLKPDKTVDEKLGANMADRK
jgi:hypothetical protein